MASVTTGTALASTIDTFNDFLIFSKLIFWNSANTTASILRISLLYTSQTAKSFKTRFLPLSNQSSISPLLSNTIIIEFTWNFLFLVIKFIDISWFLMMQLVNRPQHFRFALAFTRRIFNISHFLLKFHERWLYQVPTWWHTSTTTFALNTRHFVYQKLINNTILIKITYNHYIFELRITKKSFTLAIVFVGYINSLSITWVKIVSISFRYNPY